jgi:DNA-binding response OmpR family regulator
MDHQWLFRIRGDMPDDRAVLYVEDEPLIRELGATELRDAGFEVVAAESGTAAFDALDNDAAPFCAIVTDVNLGDGPDGWEVARHARELNDALPVIYVSGANGHEWQRKGVPNSVMIAKPFKMAQIVKAICALLRKLRPNRRNSWLPD